MFSHESLVSSNNFVLKLDIATNFLHVSSNKRKQKQLLSENTKRLQQKEENVGYNSNIFTFNSQL